MYIYIKKSTNHELLLCDKPPNDYCFVHYLLNDFVIAYCYDDGYYEILNFDLYGVFDTGIHQQNLLIFVDFVMLDNMNFLSLNDFHYNFDV